MGCGPACGAGCAEASGCGSGAGGGRILSYVGPGGDYVQETSYKYVGMGAGEFGAVRIPGRGPNCCLCLLIPLGLSLLLLPFLLYLASPDTSTTTTTTTTPFIPPSTPPPEPPTTTTTKKTTTRPPPPPPPRRPRRRRLRPPRRRRRSTVGRGMPQAGTCRRRFTAACIRARGVQRRHPRPASCRCLRLRRPRRLRRRRWLPPHHVRSIATPVTTIWTLCSGSAAGLLRRSSTVARPRTRAALRSSPRPQGCRRPMRPPSRTTACTTATQAITTACTAWSFLGRRRRSSTVARIFTRAAKARSQSETTAGQAAPRALAWAPG